MIHDNNGWEEDDWEPLPAHECQCDVPQPNEEDAGRCLVCNFIVDLNDSGRCP